MFRKLVRYLPALAVALAVVTPAGAQERRREKREHERLEAALFELREARTELMGTRDDFLALGGRWRDAVLVAASLSAALDLSVTAADVLYCSTAEALAIADRAYVLQTGRIVLEGPAAEIARDRAVRQAYLGM